LRSLDEQLLRAARTRLHDPLAERAVARFSRLGEHGGVWFAIGAAGWTLAGPRRPRWRRAMGTVALAFALNTAVKLVIRRPRPSLPELPALTGTHTGLSFPSAHAATSFAGALCYSRLGVPRGRLYALAGALSFSRVYLGVHYPSDVLAGALLGTAVARFRGGSRASAARPAASGARDAPSSPAGPVRDACTAR
jgi:decaprenylphosphoryl-5-phosphoribose phosphatase